MQKNTLFFSLTALAAVMFFLNTYFTPWLADDYDYRLYYLGPDSALVNILTSLRHHYFNWGGRMLAHFMATSVLPFDSRALVGLVGVVAIATSFVFALKLLIGRLDFKNPKTQILAAMTLFGQIVGAKACLQTEYWTVGAANYLWTLPFIFWFLYLMRDFFETGDFKLSFQVVIAAIFVGQTNENVGLGLICTIAVFYWWNKRRFLPSWQLSVLTLTLLASSAVLLLAPGNMVRDHVVHPNGSPAPLQRIAMWFESLGVFAGRIDFLSVILVLGAIYFTCRKSQRTSSKPAMALIVLAAFMGLAYLGDDGNFYGRKAFQLSQILAAGLAGLVMQNLDLNRTYRALVLTLLIFANLRLGFDFERIFRFHQEFKAREAKILKLKDEGKSEISVISFDNHTPYNLDDLKSDPSNVVNQRYSRYLGVGSLIGTSWEAGGNLGR